MSLNKQRNKIIRTKREINSFFDKLIERIDAYMESYDEIVMKKAVDELKQGINPLELKTYETLFDKLDEIYRRNEMIMNTENELNRIYSFLKYRTKYIYSDCEKRMNSLNIQIATMVEKITVSENQLHPFDDNRNDYLNKYRNEPESIFLQKNLNVVSSQSNDSFNIKEENVNSNNFINMNSNNSSPLSLFSTNNNNINNNYHNYEDEFDYQTNFEVQRDDYTIEENEIINDQSIQTISPVQQSVGIIQMMSQCCSALIQQVIPMGSTKKEKFKTQPCTYFMKYGYCRKEDNCKYSHDTNFIKAYYQNNIKPQSFETMYRRKPCKYFFENGYCSKGKHCNFSHDVSNQSQNMYQKK